MLYGMHSYDILSTVLTLMYSQSIQFVFCFELAHSWQHLNSDWNTNERQGIFLFTFLYLSIVFYTTITKNVHRINILINITENKVDWNICQGKTRAKYSRCPYDGRSGEMASSTRWQRQRNESRVLVHMPSWVNLLGIAVLGLPVLTS